MKKHSMVVVCLVLGLGIVGCQSDQPSTPSQDLKKAIKNSDINAIIENRVGVLVDGFIYGEALKEKFDRNLEENKVKSNILKNESYSRLQALRARVVEAREDLAGIYESQLKLLARPGNEAQAKEAEKILAFIDSKMNQGNVQALALSTFADEASHLRDTYSYRLEGGRQLNKDFEERLADVEQSLLTYNDPETRMELQKALGKVKGGGLVAEVSADANEITKSLKEAQINRLRAGRSASSMISPGNTKNGNISGARFPKNTWALTYDDGPHSSRTDEILNTLGANNIKATFFVVAKNLKRLTRQAQRELEMGMGLANHSYTHAQLTKFKSNNEKLEYEITEASNVLTSIWGASWGAPQGHPYRYFRLPYGAGTNTSVIRQKIAKNNMVHVFWNVDSLDWQDKDPKSIFRRVKTQMNKRGRGIILMHDIHRQTVQSSNDIIPYLKKNVADSGGVVDTVDNIVRRYNSALSMP